MDKALEIEELRKGILHLYGARSARHLETVPVKESFQGQTVWEGEVEVFALEGHPTAQRAYAWSHPTDRGTRKVFAVLHQGPVDSPLNAVRASIVAENKH